MNPLISQERKEKEFKNEQICSVRQKLSNADMQLVSKLYLLPKTQNGMFIFDEICER
jgi:hypothetical protein